MVDEGWTLEAVGGSTGSLHSIGHSRWSTREDTDLGKEDVLFLEVVKELVKVGTTKVGGATKTSKQTLARQLLEMTLTDVLLGERKDGRKSIAAILDDKGKELVYVCVCVCLYCS